MKKLTSLFVLFLLALIISGCSEKADNSLLSPQVDQKYSETVVKKSRDGARTSIIKYDFYEDWGDSLRPKSFNRIVRDTIK
jgi:ABC-type uncharacterized transport system auxiliary subunit